MGSKAMAGSAASREQLLVDSLGRPTDYPLSAAGLQDHLGPAFFALVEVLVAFGRLLERKLMRDDERRTDLVLLDQLAEEAVICLHVALPRAQALALEPEHAEV